MEEPDRWAALRVRWEQDVESFRRCIRSEQQRHNTHAYITPHLFGRCFAPLYLHLTLCLEYLGRCRDGLAAIEEAGRVIRQYCPEETAVWEELGLRRRRLEQRLMSPPPALALPKSLYVGTSSFTAESWSGPFYPKSLPDPERLTFYSQHFRSVEIDSTWYGAPRPSTVAAWREKTPDDFVFSAKVPKVITHERVLLDCETDLELFVEVMRGLGEKLGPLLLQFPHFSGRVFPSLSAFLERLDPFLALLPPDLQWAVEVRNRPWLAPPLYEVLHRHGVALAWIDYPRMPLPQYYATIPQATTADFVYLRLLGDREGIERATTSWDRLVYDRSRQLAAWAETLTGSLQRVARVHVYANNHYAGCGYQTAEQLALRLG